MQKYRVYFATKDHVPTRWFRPKKEISETEYVVVHAHNEAHASKEAKQHVDIAALGIPFQVTHIEHAPDSEPEGCHGQLARRVAPQAHAQPEAEAAPEPAPLGEEAEEKQA
jgi:hypothetical protein